VVLDMAKDILDELGIDGQSSEYTDDEDSSALKVTVPRYRRKAISPLLHNVDEQGRKAQTQLMRGLGVRSYKKAVKKRRITEEVSTRKYMKGLPRSFYDPGFLAGLSVAESDLLSISDKPTPFFEEWAGVQEARGGGTAQG
jgi:hypothetical protein